MDKREVEEIVLNVLGSLIDSASGQAAGSLIASSHIDDTIYSSTSTSFQNLSSYASRCVVNIGDEGSYMKENGEGDGNPYMHENETSYEDIQFTQQSAINSNVSYLTDWNFYPESSEDNLNLLPTEMCENWEDDEDKRRKVYWGNRGLIQERYERTLFRDNETPDEARPTLTRVSSEELISGRVPFVSEFVTSRRLPTGVSIGLSPTRRKRIMTDSAKDWDGNSGMKKFKTLLNILYKKLINRFPMKVQKNR